MTTTSGIFADIRHCKGVLPPDECTRLYSLFGKLPYEPHSPGAKPRIFRANDDDIPIFLSKLKSDLECRFPDMNCPARVVANKYSPGQGCRQHQDGPRNKRVWAVNIGLPGSTRKMRFICKKTRKRHELLLASGDVYVFHKAAYAECTHGSVANAKQLGTIYSATFRELDETYNPS